MDNPPPPPPQHWYFSIFQIIRGWYFPFIWYFLWVEHCFGFVEMSVQNGEYFNKKCPHFILLDF